MRFWRDTMNRKELDTQWKSKIIGQNHAIEKVIPYVVRALADLTPENRPIGNFFLLGPSGVGKTRTAETLAEVLHGSEKNVLRIDCGEFQMEHEVAKLIGAPPGYLGHRETSPLLSQQKLNSINSTTCPISIVLFDEIEKASSSMWRILLGILDNGTLKLGDNSTVTFNKSIIFMTSNLGTADIEKLLNPQFGFNTGNNEETSTSHLHIMEKVGKNAVKRRFPSEFQNRIDEIISYYPLESSTLKKIAALELEKTQTFITNKLQRRTFYLKYDDSVIDFVTKHGTNKEYGARELKRTITRHLINPLADLYIEGEISPLSFVTCSIENDKLVWNVISSDVEFIDEIVEAPVIKKRKAKNSILDI
jgi:ATP-dependent Clp protease ATP-binding subunit ClpA